MANEVIGETCGATMADNHRTYECVKPRGHVGNHASQRIWISGSLGRHPIALWPQEEGRVPAPVPAPKPAAPPSIVFERAGEPLPERKSCARCAELERENADLRDGVEAGKRAAFACSTVTADLVAIGTLCAIRDDEYPLKAAQRVVAERDAARARVKEMEGALAPFAAMLDGWIYPVDGRDLGRLNADLHVTEEHVIIARAAIAKGSERT